MMILGPLVFQSRRTSASIPTYLRNLTAREHGQAIIEFALVVPVLILIMLGILDLSRMYQTYIVVANASREGARWGATHPADTATIRLRAVQEAQAADSKIVLTISDPVCRTYPSDAIVACADAANGDKIKVTATATFQFATLYIFRLPSLTISNNATMAILNNNPGP